MSNSLTINVTSSQLAIAYIQKGKIAKIYWWGKKLGLVGNFGGFLGKFPTTLYVKRSLALHYLHR